MRPYSYNENYAAKINEEIDKLREAWFIYEIEHTKWVSPLVVVPKKNKNSECVSILRKSMPSLFVIIIIYP